MNHLKFWRQERGLSQVELATAANIPRWNIQLIEAGVRQPDFKEKEAITQILGVSPERLFPESCN